MNIKLANEVKKFRRTIEQKKKKTTENKKSQTKNVLYFRKSTVRNKNLSTTAFRKVS